MVLIHGFVFLQSFFFFSSLPPSPRPYSESLVYTVGSVALASAVCLFALPEESFAAAAAPTAAEHTRGEAGVGVPACLQKALSKIKMNINVNERQGAQKLEVGPVSASPSTATSTTATSSSSSSVFRSVSKKKKVPKGTGSLILGQGSSVAGIAFAYKTLLCWCAEDVELASTATDLGYLSFVGCFSMFTVREHYKVARVFMIQAALSHILLEMVFELGVMRFFDPKAKTHRMSWDMIFHHIGSLATGLYCVKAGGGSFCNGPFLKQGARLACTEITTGFPVAFKAALKNKKFKGKRRVFFAAGMPLAFMWRSWYTLDVLKSFLKTVDELGGRKAVPSKWVGAGCFGSIVFCNMYWTLRIFSGVLKTIRGKKKGKKKDAEQGEKS